MTVFNKIGDGYEMEKEAKDKTYGIGGHVTGEQIENIIVTALEGGIGYWATLNNSTPDFDNKPKGMSVSQYVTQLLLDEKTVELYDTEDPTERWQLDLTQLLKGTKEYFDSLDDFDSNTADCIIQFALFGELVYS